MQMQFFTDMSHALVTAFFAVTFFLSFLIVYANLNLNISALEKENDKEEETRALK